MALGLLWGASEIAEHCNVHPRQVYAWAEKRKRGEMSPPLFWVGKRLGAKGRELDDYFSSKRP